MTSERIDFLGLPLNTGVTIADICALMKDKNGPHLVSFINPASWALSKRNADYGKALEGMSYVLPDGQGVALACRWLTGQKAPRISFDMSSLADPFFKAASEAGATVVLAGGKPGVDEHTQEKLRTHYPNLKIIGTQHGFAELAPKIVAILKLAPDAVVVGMGSPRQEMFLIALRASGYKGLAITCGGFFDQYLEADDYYPKWINQLHLRFAWRLFKEPKRLWRRYLIDYQLFIWRFLQALWGKYWPKAEAKFKQTAAKLRRE